MIRKVLSKVWILRKISFNFLLYCISPVTLNLFQGLFNFGMLKQVQHDHVTVIFDNSLLGRLIVPFLPEPDSLLFRFLTYFRKKLRLS